MKENPASARRGSDRLASRSERSIETWIAQGSGEVMVPGRAGWEGGRRDGVSTSPALAGAWTP